MDLSLPRVPVIKNVNVAYGVARHKFVDFPACGSFAATRAQTLCILRLLSHYGKNTYET